MSIYNKYTILPNLNYGTGEKRRVSAIKESDNQGHKGKMLCAVVPEISENQMIQNGILSRLVD